MLIGFWFAKRADLLDLWGNSEELCSSLVVLLGFFGTSVSSNLGVSLLDEGESDTFALGEGDEGSFALTDAEHIAQTG